ncbi:hypothetical protein CVIRNUC_007980 [Coccomyxa viridis]|uniref:Uncharacterized protein n=1 Tax=Coccomyxa viridis TaxID=1274662 RepID=A0AAV1IDJ2_9CHLO|nr:hypothetical protein CVIRNUC_007980 [Coccomyxa viridis]
MPTAWMPSVQSSATCRPQLHDSASCSTLHSSSMVQWRMPSLRPLHCLSPQLKQGLDRRCRATATEEASDTELGAADLEQWQLCQAKLAQLGFEEEECDTVLKKAFGWAGQAYWRKSKVKEVPTEQQVDAVKAFLQGLKFSEADIKKAVKTFPEVLGLPVEQQLQGNVEKLKKDWKMTDKVIPNVVKRQPAVLGYNVDCEGNCQGDCNRCWVRF